MLDPEPLQLGNTDGDELVFHDLRFPLAAGVVQKDVVAELRQVPAFDPAGPKIWNCLATEGTPANRPSGGIVLGQVMSGVTVLGVLELKGKALIMDTLGDLLKPPLTAIRTVEQVMAERDDTGDLPDEDEISPEIARQIVHEHLDQHYRDTLEQPVPALGGKTPRQAVRSAAGRKKVVDWLKLIENRSASQPGSPLAEYDFGWIWEELGVSGDRR